MLAGVLDQGKQTIGLCHNRNVFSGSLYFEAPERQSPDQVEEHCWAPRVLIPGIFTPSPHLGSQPLIKSVAYGFLKSHNHSGTRQELSVLTSGEILNASMSVPMLCDVALALRPHVGVPSAVCVAEQACVILRAGIYQHLSRLGTAERLWIPLPGCATLLPAAKPSVVLSVAISRRCLSLIGPPYHNHSSFCYRCFTNG